MPFKSEQEMQRSRNNSEHIMYKIRRSENCETVAGFHLLPWRCWVSGTIHHLAFKESTSITIWVPHPIVRSITTDREIDFFTGWVPSCVRLYQTRYLSSRPGGQSIHCGASVDQYTRYRHVCGMQNSRNIRSVLF